MQSKSGSATPSVRWNVLRLLGAGRNAKEISESTGVPFNTIRRWSEDEAGIRRITKERLRNREAFHSVVSTYNDTLSVLGTPGAMDYSHITGGSGAQYAPDKGIGFLMIDFTVDVDNTVKSTLTAEEQKFWLEKIRLQDYDMTVQSEAFVAFQEFLGSEFIARGLYPVSEYFGELKPKPTLVPYSGAGSSRRRFGVRAPE